VTGARRILANTAYRALADVASKVASLVFFVVLARELGEADFGVFTFAFTLVLLLTVLGNFGQDAILTREVARDRGLLDDYFANTLALKVAVSLPLLAVGLAVGSLVGIDARTRDVVAILGLAVVAEMLMATCFATFQSFERLVFIPVALISQRFATAIVGVAALLAGAGLRTVALIYLGGAVLGIAIALIALVTRVSRPRLRLEPGRWPTLMRAALWTGLAGVFAVILFRVDTAMLAAYEPDSVVGNYGAAYRLVEATLFLSWSVGAAVYPVFSRLRPDSDPPVTAVFERAVKLVVALTLPLSVGAAVFARPLVELLYGREYSDAAGALALLAPTIALYPLCYLTGSLLVAQNRQHLTALVYGAMAVENILANLVLIPWLSLDGAAIGTSLTQLLVAVAMLSFARDLTAGCDWRRALAGPVLSTSLAVAAMALLRDDLLLGAATAAVVYVGSMVAFERAVFPDDARTFLDFVRRSRAVHPARQP
jgi:O-antigen/teichoic acid export membrane protein